MTKEQRTNAVAIRDSLEGIAPNLQSLLPAAIQPQKFLRVVFDALNRNPELRECTPASVVDACSKAAADGLVLDGREAALVIYNKRAQVNGEWQVVERQAQYIPMVAGLRRRIFNSGQVSAMETGIVYEAEMEAGRFDWQAGTDGYLMHKPLLAGELGPPVAVYSVVTMSNGAKSTEVMRWSEVMRIARLQSKNVASRDDTRKGIKRGDLAGIWAQHTDEMARKTVLRRHAKQLPFDSDTARAFGRVDSLYRDESDEGEEFDSQTGEITEPQKPAGKQAGAGRERLRQARQAPPQQERPEVQPDVEDLEPVGGASDDQTEEDRI